LLWTECALRVARASAYFDERGRSPAELTLRVVAPSVIRGDGRALEWIRRLRSAIAAKVGDAHRQMRRASRAFAGRAAVLAQSCVARATSYAPKRGLIPTVAAKDSAARIAMLAMQRAFRRAYRTAVDQWKAGARDALFPFGTWWMRVHHGAVCAAASLDP
jgi:putative transposase